MSKVGYVEKMYGESFKLVTTNASGSKILDASDMSLTTTALIVASPVQGDGITDTGQATLLVTDFEGSPMRLTYVVESGSGLITENDTMKMTVDPKMLETNSTNQLKVNASGIVQENNYVKVNNNEIYLDAPELIDNIKIKSIPYSLVDPSSSAKWRNVFTVDLKTFVDNDTTTIITAGGGYSNDSYLNQRIKVNVNNIVDTGTIKVRSGRAYVDTTALSQATQTQLGVVKYDASTIKKNNNGQLYVDTVQLKHITTSEGYGTVWVPEASTAGEPIVGNAKGKLVVKTEYLPKCTIYSSSTTNKGYGVAAVDGTTIRSNNNGILSVITEGLGVPTSNKNGVVRPDQTTIKLDKDGRISVLTKNLTECSPSISGITKYDNTTITKNAAGQLQVKNASQWDSAISNLQNQISGLSNQIVNLRQQLESFVGKVSTSTAVQFLVQYGGKSVETLTMSIFVTKTLSAAVTSGSNNVIKTGLVTKSGSIVSQSAAMTTTASVMTTYTSPTYNIKYAGGYPFTFEVSNMNASWCSIQSIVIGGKSYSPGSIMTITGADNANFQIRIAYNASSIRNSKTALNGFATLTFKDSNSGNILKTISITVTGSVKSSVATQQNVTIVNNDPVINNSGTSTTLTKITGGGGGGRSLQDLLIDQAGSGATTVTGNNVLNSKLAQTNLQKFKSIN